MTLLQNILPFYIYLKSLLFYCQGVCCPWECVYIIYARFFPVPPHQHVYLYYIHSLQIDLLMHVYMYIIVCTVCILLHMHMPLVLWHFFEVYDSLLNLSVVLKCWVFCFLFICIELVINSEFIWLSFNDVLGPECLTSPCKYMITADSSLEAS